MFAACVLSLIGLFQVIAGLTAIIDDEFFVVRGGYTFELDVTTWGWIHVLIGVFTLAVGLGLFTGRRWAGRRARPRVAQRGGQLLLDPLLPRVGRSS